MERKCFRNQLQHCYICVLLLSTVIFVMTSLKNRLLVDITSSYGNWTIRREPTGSRPFEPVPIEQYSAGHKVILMWTQWFGRHNWMYSFGKKTLLALKCPEPRCYLTSNRASSSEASLLLFHVRDLRDLPSQHPVAQRWVFVTTEAPVHTYLPGHLSTDLSAFDGVFNMTATYMPQSDIYIPYNSYHPYEHNSSLWNNTERNVNIIASKSGMALWFVSNCKSEQTKWRRKYVQELGQFIHVDTFGKCGATDPCSSAPNTKTCIAAVINKYKFYLAFENSVCRHYVTEKFWNALKHNVVPIVLGSSMADTLAVAPPDSFLHVDNFTSPADLAEYMRYLDSDPAAYQKYFKWKEQFEIKLLPTQRLLCQLCKAAHETNVQPKTYNVSQWYSSDSLCRLI